MGAPQSLQLDPVLQRAQEPVCRAQHRRIVPADIATGGERSQRVERRSRVEGGVGAPVDQLQQLHAELDVPQAPRPELELSAGLAVGDVCFHAPAHRLHVVDEVFPGRGLPDHRPDGGQVGLADFPIARDRTRLQQGLKLPGLGPPLVVVPVARHRPHERARLPLRPQRGVHRPKRAGGRGLATSGHDARRHRGPDAHGLFLGHAGRGLGDEDDVHIGDVVELASTGLAHRDDGEANRVRGGPGLHPGDLVCRFQRRLGQVGERGGGPREFFQRVGRGEIEGSDAQKSSPVKHPEGVLWAKPVGRILDLADDASDPLLDRAGFRFGDAAPMLGVADQMIAKGDGGPEDGEQSLPADAGTTQLRDERRHLPVQRGRLGFPVGGGAQSLHQAHEAEQRQVGIGHLGQRLDRSVGEGVVQWIDQTGEGGIAEQSSRPIRLREPQTGEHGLGAAGAGRGHPLSLTPRPDPAAGSARDRGVGSRPRVSQRGRPGQPAGAQPADAITCGASCMPRQRRGRRRSSSKAVTWWR